MKKLLLSLTSMLLLSIATLAQSKSLSKKDVLASQQTVEGKKKAPATPKTQAEIKKQKQADMMAEKRRLENAQAAALVDERGN